MVAVAITGILAAIAIVLVRGHVQVAKANRAMSGIQGIRAAEESFRAQNGQYLDCSANNARWYPMATPSKLVYEWHQVAHPDYAKWMGLGVAGIPTTQYGFLVSAGNPSIAYPTLQTATKPVLPAATDYWYVIQVKGDLDGNGVFMLGTATSLNGEVYVEHESE
jgi:type IV pilus assembly protein PilA